jgi:hypothetical protein
MKESYKHVFRVLAFNIQVIAAASYFYHFDKIGHGSEVQTGRAPKNPAGFINVGWYRSYSLFAFGTISLILAVCELTSIVGRQLFLFMDSMVVRGGIYILKGIATLGTSNDLGVAAGSMEIILGGTLILAVFVESCLECRKRGCLEDDF